MSIAKTAEGNAEKPAKELNICIERFRAEFGESKQDKCHQLALELSAITQERDMSVELEMSFQTPPTASNTNQWLRKSNTNTNEWVCLFDHFEASRSALPSPTNSLLQLWTNNLSRNCPKNCKDT